VVEDVDLVTGPAALAAARRSLNDSGLLLLGEVHGVRENPLDWSWSRRDEAMAGRILAGSPAGTRTLAVAGNAHTPTRRTDLGIPLGACLARQRPGVREIQIHYGSGHYYNMQPRRSWLPSAPGRP
jgi:hypothetical protein